ncbi:hypothetical protein [Devriesea agamarum]|uniref:hypothetical protein n=1 Tax=Devriesea agamarum TaxID=472569 RepID=UPI00071C3725|nr:hypothetical protein [Devriesea agamarum]
MDTVRLSEPLLLLDVAVYSASDPHADALLIDNGVVAWIGSASSARVLHPTVRSISLDGCLVTPPFVDSCAGNIADPTPRPTDLARGILHRIPGLPRREGSIEVMAPCERTDAPFGDLTASGTVLTFGSGGELGFQDPWQWMLAATRDASPDQRLSDRAAFLAASRGGHRLLGDDHPGSLLAGVPATLVIWRPWDLIVRGADERIQTWSTDPRSRTPRLPDLSSGNGPRALMAFAAGHLVFDGRDDIPQAPQVPGSLESWTPDATQPVEPRREFPA